MRNFDLYWVRFHYEDTSEYKYRPALIINDQIVRLSKITSNLDRIETPYYILKDWREAGLTKESLVRITKTVDVNNQMLRRYIGHLSQRDECEIKNMIDTYLLNESDLRFFERFFI